MTSEPLAVPSGSVPAAVPSGSVPGAVPPGSPPGGTPAHPEEERRPGPPDPAVGSFTAEPPWLVEPERLVWAAGVDAIRRRTAAQVPGLLRRSRLPALGPVVRMAVRLGPALLGWWVLDRHRARATGDRTVSRAGLSRRLRTAFQALGPTYIKMGQIISSGEGLFPPELVSEFRMLRDRVPPETFEAVRRVVEEELGRPLDAVFLHFDPEPLAAASIAQVHAAVLSSGEEVVVKVQRPDIARRVRRDIRAMSWVAPLLIGRIPVTALANPPALVELFAETIVEELDFQLEAQNMLDVARVLAATDERSLVVPRPHPALITRRVLVMERLSGFGWDDVAGMRRAGVDTEAVVRAVMVAFLEGAALFGVFHGDLHGGNLFVRPDGRVALLDYGITGRLDEPRRLAFLRLLVAGSMNDPLLQLSALRDLGALPADTDLEAVVTDLGLDHPPVDPLSLTPEQLLDEVRDLTRKLLSYGARFPKVLMLFVKDLLFLDGALATLAPDVDLLTEVTQISAYFAERYGERITAEIGLDPRRAPLTRETARTALGLGEDVEELTYRDLQERRELIRRRTEEHHRRSVSPGPARRAFRTVRRRLAR